MKKLNLFTTTGAVSLLSLTLATATYAEEKKSKTQTKDQKEQSNQEKKAADRSSDQLLKQSQASKIIGMNITNAQGQELGEVKDIALDLHTGKITYVVVGWGQKATIVPSFLFLPDPQGDKLRLQATIEQMRNAPGIQLSELPEIHSDHPIVDYWREQTATAAAGSSQGGEQGTASQTSNATKKDQEKFSGRVIAIDPNRNTVTVEGPVGRQVFVVDRTAAIQLRQVSDTKLSNLSVGDKIDVEFQKKSDGQGTAFRIEKHAGDK